MKLPKRTFFPMDNNSGFSNLLKRKASKTYGYECHSCDFLSLTNLSTDESQTDIASNKRFLFLLKTFFSPRIDKYTIQLNEIQYFCIKRIVNIIEPLIFVGLEKSSGFASRKYLLPENKLSSSYSFNLNEVFKGAVNGLNKFIEFSLLNFHGEFIICFSWYMEGFFDSCRFISNGKLYDVVKRLGCQNGDETATFLHIFSKISVPQLAQMYGKGVDEVAMDHQKNHGKFYLEMISIQNPTFFFEDSIICYGEDTYRKYDDDNNANDGINISYHSDNIQQEQTEKKSVNNIHQTTVFPLFKDEENQIDNCSYDCRGRSYYRRFCRDYDQKSDYHSGSINCKYPSSSERLFALDEEHSMLCIPESKTERKSSTESEFWTSNLGTKPSSIIEIL